jgi:peptidylprolyl isomerase
MRQAKQGDSVKVHYTGKMDNGTKFDTSRGGDPLEFTIGEGKIIPGFEEIVVGMTQGDTKTATVPSDKAYGPRRDDRIITVDRDQVPEGMSPKVGQQVQMHGKGGESIPAMITGVTEKLVTLDANHPLAGKDLTFTIELVEIL